MTQEQEEKDYRTVKRILEDLFKDKLVRIEKRPEYSPSDCLYSAQTKDNNIRAYSLEIKEVKNIDYIFEHGFLLKICKYIKLKQDRDNRNPKEKLYIIYIVPELGEYYIFDIDRIDLNAVEKVVLNLKVKQYDPHSARTEYACLYIPLTQCQFKGQYNVEKT